MDNFKRFEDIVPHFSGLGFKFFEPVRSVFADVAARDRTASPKSAGHGEASGEPAVSSSSSSVSKPGQGHGQNQGSGQARSNDLSRPEIRPRPIPADEASAPHPSKATGSDVDTILSTIKRLAKLCKAGVLSDEEYATKKTELLARL